MPLYECRECGVLTTRRNSGVCPACGYNGEPDAENLSYTNWYRARTDIELGQQL